MKEVVWEQLCFQYNTTLHNIFTCGDSTTPLYDIISSRKQPEGRADELFMFMPLSLKSRQTPTLSLSVAPPVNRSYTEMASAERAANTATVDFDTGCLQPDMSTQEEQMSTLAHATVCTVGETGASCNRDKL